MALTINKSMNISDFWRCWEHIVALVEEEYLAVKGCEGFYDLQLELIWDCEDQVASPGSGDGFWDSVICSSCL